MTLWQLVICSLFIIIEINCFPVEVTGENIKYYQLSPNAGSGSYNFNYGTKDGAERSERGFIKQDSGSAEPLLVVSGSFKYPNSNEVYYIADEQGYRIVSKEEIDKLYEKHSDNDLPPAASTTSLATTVPTVSLEPKTESHIIKVNIKPAVIKPRDCLLDECKKMREAKIIKIKPIKFG